MYPLSFPNNTLKEGSPLGHHLSFSLQLSFVCSTKISIRWGKWWWRSLMKTSRAAVWEMLIWFSVEIWKVEDRAVFFAWEFYPFVPSWTVSPSCPSPLHSSRQAWGPSSFSCSSVSLGLSDLLLLTYCGFSFFSFLKLFSLVFQLVLSPLRVLTLILKYAENLNFKPSSSLIWFLAVILFFLVAYLLMFCSFLFPSLSIFTYACIFTLVSLLLFSGPHCPFP